MGLDKEVAICQYLFFQIKITGICVTANKSKELLQNKNLQTHCLIPHKFYKNLLYGIFKCT